MATPNHSDYRIEILCPDLASEVRLERGTAQERLGTLFEINLSLYSEDKEIDLVAMLGKPMAVHVATANDERYFHGIVSNFSLVGFTERYGHYQVVLRPKLWLLGQSASCKVFRSMTVADILQKTFQQGSVDIGGVATSPAVQFEHCVQYRETDLYFVSRLMERYGYYYFHKHGKSSHRLEVVSGLSGHGDVGTFAYAADGTASEEHQITAWRATTSLRSGSYRVAGTKNLTRQPIDAKHKTRFSVAASPGLKIDEFEAVDEYEKPYLDELAKARMQAIDATVEEFTGQSSSPKLAVGALFKLDGHTRQDQNRQYLVVAATYQFDGDLQDGSPASTVPYLVTFSAIDSKTPFSPPVVTRKPVVQGPHLATVTEETDDHGRVQVQFHWGNPDGDIESCRARVSQNWAGKEWGGVFLPHTGHEVIVEFLDGDPDQPIVTGRVYNSESMPPLSLPGDKQKSIIRDHGGNEIVMDGTGGAQKIRVFCPKHKSEMVLGNSITLSSDSNWINTFLGYNETKITGKSTTSIGNDNHVSIGGSKQEHIVGKFVVKVGADVMETLLGAQHRNIVGLTSLLVGGVKKEHIIGAEWKRIDGLKRERINGATMRQGNAKEVGTYPDALKKVGGALVEMAKNMKADVKDVFWLNAKTARLKAKEKLEKVEKGEIEIKQARYKGETHRHLPSDMFAVNSDKIVIDGASVVIDGSSISIGGHALEVKK